VDNLEIERVDERADEIEGDASASGQPLLDRVGTYLSARVLLHPLSNDRVFVFISLRVDERRVIRHGLSP